MKKAQINKIQKLFHVQNNNPISFSTDLISSARQRNLFIQKKCFIHKRNSFQSRFHCQANANPVLIFAKTCDLGWIDAFQHTHTYLDSSFSSFSSSSFFSSSFFSDLSDFSSSTFSSTFSSWEGRAICCWNETGFRWSFDHTKGQHLVLRAAQNLMLPYFPRDNILSYRYCTVVSIRTE